MSGVLRYEPKKGCQWAVIRDDVTVAELSRQDGGLVVVQTCGTLSATEAAGVAQFLSEHQCSKCKHRDAECSKPRKPRDGSHVLSTLARDNDFAVRLLARRAWMRLRIAARVEREELERILRLEDTRA